MSLVGVETWNQQDMINVVPDPDALLDNFHDFLESGTETFDSAMLITLVVMIMHALLLIVLYIVA